MIAGIHEGAPGTGLRGGEIAHHRAGITGEGGGQPEGEVDLIGVADFNALPDVSKGLQVGLVVDRRLPGADQRLAGRRQPAHALDAVGGKDPEAQERQPAIGGADRQAERSRGFVGDEAGRVMTAADLVVDLTEGGSDVGSLTRGDDPDRVAESAPRAAPRAAQQDLEPGIARHPATGPPT